MLIFNTPPRSPNQRHDGPAAWPPSLLAGDRISGWHITAAARAIGATGANEKPNLEVRNGRAGCGRAASGPRPHRAAPNVAEPSNIAPLEHVEGARKACIEHGGQNRRMQWRGRRAARLSRARTMHARAQTRAVAIGARAVRAVRARASSACALPALRAPARRLRTAALCLRAARAPLPDVCESSAALRPRCAALCCVAPRAAAAPRWVGLGSRGIPGRRRVLCLTGGGGADQEGNLQNATESVVNGMPP